MNEDLYHYDWTLHVYVAHTKQLGYEEYLFQAYGQEMNALKPIRFIQHKNMVMFQGRNIQSQLSDTKVHKVLQNYCVCRCIRQQYVHTKVNAWNLVVFQPIRQLHELEAITRTIDLFITNNNCIRQIHQINQHIYFLESRTALTVLERSIPLKFSWQDIIDQVVKFTQVSKPNTNT